MARIIVVDDNDVSRGLMTYLLEARGHLVLSFEDGRSALAGVDRFRPDLVLCDLKMPGLDGYAVARTLSAPAARRGVALAAITASDRPADETAAHAAGFQAFLRKPIEHQAFTFAIEDLLARTADERRAPTVALTGLKPREPS